MKPASLSPSDRSLPGLGSRLLWIATLSMIGVSIWIPCDSTAIQEGKALPQVAVWLLLAFVQTIIHFFEARKGGAKGTDQTERGQMIGIPWGMILLVLLLGWVWLSAWGTQLRGNRMFAFHGAWQWTGMAAALWLLVTQLRSRVLSELATSRALRFMLLAVAFTAAWHGLYQYSISLPNDRMEYERNPDLFLRSQGMDAPKGSTTRMQLENRLYSTEPFGPFALANSLAGLLVPSVLLLAAWLPGFPSKPSSNQGSKRKPRWLYLGFLFACLSLCLLLTKSRSGWIAVAISLGLYAFLVPTIRSWCSQRRGWIVGSFLFLIAIGVGLIMVVDPLILTETPKSFSYRLEYWQSSLQMILEHPWFGVGPGNFQAFYPAYKLVEASETIADPHSFTLEVAATSGIPAVALLALGFILLFTRRLWTASESLIERANIGGHYEKMGIDLVMALVLGTALTWLVPGLIGEPTDPIPYFLSVPIMIAIILWDSRATYPAAEWNSRNAVGCGILGCMIHWCGSGGWMTPGNMVPFIALIALWVTHPQTGLPKSISIPVRLTYSTRSLIGLVVTGVAISYFMVSAWRPYHAIGQWEREQLVANSVERAMLLAERASLEAPDSPEPLRVLVHLRYRELESALRRVGGNNRPEFGSRAFEEYLSLQSSWEKRNPHDWNLYCEEGNQLLALGIFEPKALPLATAKFAKASELHPSSGWLHLQAGIAFWFAGDREESERRLRRAIEINERNPHWDQKIAMARVLWPTIPPSSQTLEAPQFAEEMRIRPNSDPASPPDFCEGEPALVTLRKLLRLDSQ